MQPEHFSGPLTRSRTANVRGLFILPLEFFGVLLSLLYKSDDFIQRACIFESYTNETSVVAAREILVYDFEVREAVRKLSGSSCYY